MANIIYRLESYEIMGACFFGNREIREMIAVTEALAV